MTADTANLGEYRDETSHSDRRVATLLKKAEKFAAYVSEIVGPRSVLDLGCGRGDWLELFRRNGASRLAGMDGPSALDEEKLCPSMTFQPADFEGDYRIGQTYDLAVCLDTAEHLSQQSATRLIEALTQAAPCVLFSAAIPHQPGINNINCQYQSYWAQRFSRLGYDCYDIRPALWSDSEIPVHYRQNILLYVSSIDNAVAHIRDKIAHKRVSDLSLLDVVHPEMYQIFVDKVRRGAAEIKQIRKSAADVDRIEVIDLAGTEVANDTVPGPGKIALVSANFGEYDDVKDMHPVIQACGDLAATFFVTDSERTAEQAIKCGWQTVYLLTKQLGRLDNRLRAKFFKINPHRIRQFQNFPYFIWLDSSLRVEKPNWLRAFMETGLSSGIEDNFLCFRHSRQVMGAEFDFIIENVSDARYLRELNQKEPVAEQYALYKSLGLDMQLPLYMGALFMHGNGEKVRAACDFWWNMNVMHSARDQLSLPVALGMFNLQPVATRIRFDSDVVRVPHRKSLLA